MNFEVISERQALVETRLDRFLEEIGVDSWTEVSDELHEEYRSRLLGIGYLILGTGKLESVDNSATFSSIHSY